MRIPWAKFTEVVKESDIFITLQRENLKVEVSKWGYIELETDSRKDIEEWMGLDEALTKEFQQYYNLCSDKEDWSECAKNWIVGKDPEGLLSEGPFEWYPTHKKKGKVGDLGTYRSGMVDGWIGSEMCYVHFTLHDERQLAVIFWDCGGDPEIWEGDFDGFILSQLFDYTDLDEAKGINRFVENGILWAFDQFGMFEEDMKDLPNWAWDLILKEPDHLWPDLVGKLREKFETLPREIQEAVRRWEGMRRRKMEKFTGQKHLWPRLYRRK